MGNRSYPGTVLGDVVGAAAWGSKIYTLRGGWMAASRCVRCMQWLCWVFVFGAMDSCQDVPQYKVMKYLVFGIISSSLLSELQVMISKVECDGVCICMVYPTLWPGGTAECVYRPPLRLVPSVLMSVRFLWLCRLPLRNFLVCVFCWISYWL